MKNKVISIFLFIVLLLVGCKSKPSADPVDYVNPYMGNISHLLVPTYPTIHLPNSFLRVYPQRNDFTGDQLYGLPVVVTSHRGSSAFNLSPVAGKSKDFLPVHNYSYDLEKITPFDYSVYLDEQEIGVQLAVSHQSAIYRFTYPKEKPAALVINAAEGNLKWDGTAITGFQQLQNDTRVFVHLKPENSPSKVTALNGEGAISEGTELSGENIAMVLHFNAEGDVVNLRYGISFIDSRQAGQNVKREIADFDLEKVRKKGRDLWNESLAKIKIKGGTRDQNTVFYTSL
ncbi:MAG: glycoside hydrolase family 92 protein [Spirochaetales bacterium]|nr:glycoside hydrolase family 92 protein [Spirochaetales bacterium]